MPAALPLDWSAVQATYAAVGGNAEITAKAHGIESAAVRQRAKRGEWKTGLSQSLSQAGVKQAAAPVTAVTAIDPVTAMSQAVTEAKAHYRGRGQLAVTIAAALGAEDIATRDVEEIHQLSPVLVQYATALHKASPELQQSNGPLVSLTFASSLPDYLKPCGTPVPHQLPTAPVEEE